MELTVHRLLRGSDPTFTDPFILADVVLDPDNPRQFDNFSGDLSGRVLEVMSAVGAEIGERRRLDSLVDQILAQQRADGRFGRAELSFDTGELDREHMALLWGNGRLLVGLMTYYATCSRADVLAAVERLAIFLERICHNLPADNLNAKLATAGAYGFICLTQCNEGLALLYQTTRDRRWLDLGLRVSRWLAPPGTQHSHGVLTTLRGLLMLHEFTKDPADLAVVEEMFSAILQSRTDRLIFGGVPEYFGAFGDESEEVKRRSGGYVRDEGCSEADFTRLCLQLWRATGNIRYLEHAEHCFLNHLLANQFDNGDFGSRVLSRRGFWPSESPGRAWWCCTMHALRAFRDVLDSVVTRMNENELRINLFLDAHWADDSVELNMEQTGLDQYCISIRRAPPHGIRLSIREPSWSRGARLSAAGAHKAGATVQVAFDLKTRLINREGHELSLEQLTEASVEAAMFHGPWLIGASALDQPMFYSEPSQGNVIQVPANMRFAWQDDDVSVMLPYQHEGYVQSQQTTLHWAGGRLRNAGGAFAVWLRYQSATRASSTAPAASP